MGRKRKNRYRLTIGGTKLELSLLKEFCDTATDSTIVREMLIHFRFWNVLEAFDDGKLDYTLKQLR
ncbi:hypothetical protein [Enterococcus sp. AZ072]|uniref:hypothetical protein n=1 Tax=unclassified Enterococcus TaxID=2608891 RepID=UPI003D2B7D1D